MKSYFDVVKAVRSSLYPVHRDMSFAVHVTACVVYVQCLISSLFPVSGYDKSNDDVEVSDQE